MGCCCSRWALAHCSLCCTAGLSGSAPGRLTSVSQQYQEWAVLATAPELHQAGAVLAYAGCKLHICHCVFVSAPESCVWRQLSKHLNQGVVHLLRRAGEAPAEQRSGTLGCCWRPLAPATFGCCITTVLQLLACTGCTCSKAVFWLQQHFSCSPAAAANKECIP